MKSTQRLLCAICFLLIAMPLKAATCLSIFSGGVSSWSSTGSVSFASNSWVENAGLTEDIQIGTDASSASCKTGACTSSGNSTSKMNPRAFSYSPYSSDVYVSQNGSGSIYQGYYDNLVLYQGANLTIVDRNRWTAFDYVRLDNNATLTLQEGIYWFEYLDMRINSRIAASANDKVTILVETASLADNIRLNWQGDPEQLAVIAYGNFSLSQNSLVKGFIHSKGNVQVGQNGKWYGGINANNVSLAQNAIVRYEASSVTEAPFYDLCDNTDTLPTPLSYWPMDLCVAPNTSGAIEDNIGNNDATAVGNVSIDYNARYCQGVSLSGQKDYIDIPYESSHQISQGSISMWIKPTDMDFSKVPSTGHMTLLSRDEYGNTNGGHLTLWLTDRGGIVVRHQSSSRSYYIYSRNHIRENSWHHIVYTWGAQGMRLYIDGIYRGLNSRFAGGLAASQLPITLGANTWQYKSSSNTPRRDQLKDFYKGGIDELRLYDEQLNYTQVEGLHELDQASCLNCFGEPQLVSHWNADLCSTTANELVDVVSDSNGVMVNGAQLSTTSKFCQGLEFDGAQSYVSIAHAQNMQIRSGAVSMWFKLDDLDHASAPRNGGNALLSKDNLGYENGGHLTIRVLDTGAISVRHQTHNAQKVLETAGGLIEAGKWHFLTYSFGTRGMEIYVDGQLASSSPSHTYGLENNQEFLVLGAAARITTDNQVQTDKLRDFFKGEMDHIKLYSNQPTAANVSAWYNESSYACQTCDTLVAEYEFGAVQGQSSGLVQDISGNGNTAQLLGNAITTTPLANLSCQALAIPSNTSTSTIDALDTGIDVDEDIGPRGSISFYYRANSAWNNNQAKQIFDASYGNKYFFLSILGSGRLNFGLEDSNDHDLVMKSRVYTFDEDDWVHITATWDLVSKVYKLYVNGSDAIESVTGGLHTAALGNLNSLHIGDNATSYMVNGSTPRSADGVVDRVKIYSQAISPEQVAIDMASKTPCQQVHHYQIEHPQSAVTCANPEVVVKACADPSCTQLFAESSTVSLSPDIYEGGTQRSFVGAMTVRLNNRSSGTKTLGLTPAAPIAPVICAPDCTIEYTDAGFEFFNTLTDSSSFDGVKLSAQNPLVEVGVRAIASNGGTCGALTSGTQAVTLSYSCGGNSQFPYAPSQCKVPFAGIPLTSGNTHAGNINLTFDSNGEANLGTYRYNDVGLLTLGVGATINGAVIQPNQVTLKIVPDHLSVSTSASSPITAGSNMNLAISAKGSQGDVLPSYQANELQGQLQRILPASSQASEALLKISPGVELQSQLNDGFVNIQAPTFVNGAFTSNNAQIDELGNYALTLRDQDYLGQIISSDALAIGEIIPAYFDVQATQVPIAQDACSNQFTYVGQTFDFGVMDPQIEITAYNAQGKVTRNYAESLVKLSLTQTALNNSLDFDDTSSYSGSLQTKNLGELSQIQGLNLYDGKLSFTIDNSQLAYTKVINPIGNDASPFASSFSMQLSAGILTDSNGVCYQTTYPNQCESFNITNITGTQQRYGRLALVHAFGPENVTQRVPLQAEYLDQGRWWLNAQDSCTSIALSQSAGDIAISHNAMSAIDLSNSVSGIVSTGTLINGRAQTDDLLVGPILINGQAQQGVLNIHLPWSVNQPSWSDYLNIDWDMDGDIDANDQPSATITFGIYRGNDRTINFREVFND